MRVINNIEDLFILLLIWVSYSFECFECIIKSFPMVDFVYLR